jgi:hypothetical protein
VDRPTRIVAILGERLPRCCEYGAYPARSASPRVSARSGWWSRYLPPEGRPQGPPEVGDGRHPALRDSPTPLVTAGVSAVGPPTRPPLPSRLVRRSGAWLPMGPGGRSERRLGRRRPEGTGSRSCSRRGGTGSLGNPHRRGVLPRCTAQDAGRGNPAGAGRPCKGGAAGATRAVGTPHRPDRHGAEPQASACPRHRVDGAGVPATRVPWFIGRDACQRNRIVPGAVPKPWLCRGGGHAEGAGPALTGPQSVTLPAT